MNQSILDYYQKQTIIAENQFKKYDKQSNVYSFLRLFVLLGGSVAVYKSLQFENVFLTEFTFLGIIVAFAWLVSRQAAFDKKKAFFYALKQVNENEINSINSQENSYDDGSFRINDEHIYTSDLDVFGKASLYNLLNRCATKPGNQKLSEWLERKAATSEIIERQNAVKELAAKLKWVQDFKAVLLFAKDESGEDVQKLFKFLESPLGEFNPYLKSYVKYVPYIFFPAFVLAFYIPAFSILAGLLGVINISLAMYSSPKVTKADLFLGKAGKTLYNYSGPFRLIEEESFNSKLLSELKDEFKDAEGLSFHKKIKELSVLINRLEYRLNIFIGPILNFTLVWDLRQLIAIESWKQANTHQIEKAFDSLASIETLVSLSSLHSNYPEWSFPEITDAQGYTFIALEMGHPLIPEKERIKNNFHLQDTFKVDIITGSNMAGKSTFLRTIGINAVLALAGAPVCATQMKLSNMHVFTYMRIKDSLNEHTSTFKAELNRLKLLLQTLKTEDKVYFLIDEMLRGTNSVDKYLGSKAVIEKLISQQAVGIVATHDLQIARLEEKYPDYVRNFYFDIQVDGNEMHFDYKLKEGECKTFNVSVLLRQLGIEVENEVGGKR